MTPSIASRKRLGINASHHHVGVGRSITPAMASEIQPMLRRLATNGIRSNSEGGAATLRFGVTSAISGFLSDGRYQFHWAARVCLRRVFQRDWSFFPDIYRCCKAIFYNRAFQDSDS